MNFNRRISASCVTESNTVSVKQRLVAYCGFARLVAVLAFALPMLTVSATAASRPQLTFIQLTSNPDCNGGVGAAYPSIDATGKKIAFTSTCDLVPGNNTDGNGELFVMNADGTGMAQLTFSTGG